jgi:hypothetical protein
MEYVKLVFVLPRTDAYALSCIAEQCNLTVPLMVRKIVQAEIRRREELLQKTDFASKLQLITESSHEK